MWSIIGSDLLRVPHADQHRFGELMLESKRRVQQGELESGNGVAIVTGIYDEPVAIVGLHYMDSTREQRNERMLNAARQVLLPDGTAPRRVVVIGCDPRLQGLPYSVIALMEFDRDRNGRQPQHA